MRGPYWKKASVSARARRSRDRIAERAIRGLRNSRSVTSRCANFPRACFLRGYAGESEATRDRIAGGAVLEKKGQPSAPCGGPYWKKASVSARARHSCDRIAEQGLEICALSSARVLFAGRARGIPVIGLQVEPL